MSLFESMDNITDLSSATTHANNISNGAIGLGVPLSVAIIIIIIGIISKSKLSITFTTSLVVFTIISSLMAWAEWVNPVVVIIGGILTGLGVMWVRIEKNYS
jgi:chromate transport protein ChrA